MKTFLKLLIVAVALTLCISFLFACTGISFTINFDSNGGSKVAPIRTDGRSAIKIPDDPEKEGYKFKGWYWDNNTFLKEVTANSLMDAPISSNMTVYAKWEIEDEVELEPLELISDVFEIEDTDLYLEVPNTQTTFAFQDKFEIHADSSWTVTNDISGNDVISSKTVSLVEGNNIFYIIVKSPSDDIAVYKVTIKKIFNYEINFYSNNTIYDTITIAEGALITAPSVDPELEGYNFVEWDFDFDTIVEADTDIYAVFAIASFTISFNTNGGTNVASYNEQYGTMIYAPTSPQKHNSIFAGWFSNTACTIPYVFGTMPGQNLVLYAKWEELISPQTLADLTNYSTETRYYNVTPVVYTNTAQQQALLQQRIDERPQPGVPEDSEEYNSLSIWEKIFVNSDPADIILEMGNAGLSFDKMNAIVQYFVVQETAGDLDSIVGTGVWFNDSDWSFFDDISYLEKLKDRAGIEPGNSLMSLFSKIFDLPQFMYNNIDLSGFDFCDLFGLSTEKDKNSSASIDDLQNIKRQERKILGQLYNIGLTGDEFARLVIQQLEYAQRVTNAMHLDYDPDIDYDDYVKEDLSYNTLVYFKAINQFVQNKSQAVQLFGYYYDFNMNVFDSMDDETFEKELIYSHMDVYSDSQFIEYINIQRDKYTNAYRYTASLYQSFYQVHFQFQELLENFELEVFADPETGLPMETAFMDTNLKYSREMKRGMESGFVQQLILLDRLYMYTADETTLRQYNAANTAVEQAKNDSMPIRNEKEYLLNMEKLKVVDYILSNMSNTQLSAILRKDIMIYSSAMIKNIQQEKKAVVLMKVQKAKLSPLDEGELLVIDVEIGRTDAIVYQLKRAYTNAGPESQFMEASQTNWDNIRPEIKAVLQHNYTLYTNGTEKLEAFKDNLIKKRLVNPDGSDFREGIDDSALVREEYDTTHQISRFLNNHETIFRFFAGQITIELAGAPGNHWTTYTAYNLSSPTNYDDGIYANGNNLEGRNMPDDVVPTYYFMIIDRIMFFANLTITEGMSDANMPNFLIGNAYKVTLADQIYGGGIQGSAARRLYTYEFEGWYIDIELKYKIDPSEILKYDMILYPGYTVTKSPITV